MSRKEEIIQLQLTNRVLRRKLGMFRGLMKGPGGKKLNRVADGLIDLAEERQINDEDVANILQVDIRTVKKHQR